MPGEENPSIECECGCLAVFKKYDSAGRPRRFISGHNTRVQARHKARPFNVEWARSVVRECALHDVACFVKQLGARCVTGDDLVLMELKHRSGADPAEWPKDLRVQEWPVKNKENK